MNLIHNQQEDWWQSNIYKDGEKVIKEYIWVTKFEALLYLHTQSLFSWKEVNIDLEPPLVFQENEIVWVNIKFALIDINSINTKWDLVSVKWDFIDWYTLHSMLSFPMISNDDIFAIYRLRDVVNNYISSEYSFDMSTWFIWDQTHTLNIKFSWYNYESKKVYLIVTDIACVISDFIDNNIMLIDSLLKKSSIK